MPSLGWLQTLSDYASWQEECRVYISREEESTTNEISVVKSADGRSRESSRVRSILKKIDRRVHLIYCSDLLAKVACTTLGISLFFQVNGMLFPVESPPLRVLIVGSMLFYICFAIKPIFEKNRLNYGQDIITLNATQTKKLESLVGKTLGDSRTTKKIENSSSETHRRSTEY